MSKKIIITSGYFNPLHTGHISYLREAGWLGDKLIVIVNNDKQVSIKGSKPFMREDDRVVIVGSLKTVDEAHLSISQDGSVCKDLERIREEYPNDELIFAKGGDRTLDNIPEVDICRRNNIKMVFDIGCKKVTSSSEMLSKLYN
jgi:cytidyltransferase-like protein